MQSYMNKESGTKINDHNNTSMHAVICRKLLAGGSDGKFGNHMRTEMVLH